MYYGIYKDIRNSAWKCLIDFQIDRLPVDVLTIAKGAGIRVIKNSAVNELSRKEYGRSYFDGSKWYIIYDDFATTEQARFTVAHELGHILLGHDMKYTKYLGAKAFDKKPKSERQADLFALRLLCPACVIWGLGLDSPDEISRVCLVDADIASQRYERIEALYKRNRFLTSPLEAQVYALFDDFIKQTKAKEAYETETN